MNITQSHTEIESAFLADIIRAKIDNFLVVDCRSFLEFNTCHVTSAINAFYSKIIRRRILNSRDCAETVLNHLSRGIEDSLCPQFEQLTLILYANGYEADKKLPSFRFTSASPINFCSRFALRRSASEDTAPNLLDSNQFMTVLIERLQNTKSFTNVLLLKGGFNEFRRNFPELCDSSAQIINTPETPCATPFSLINELSCLSDASANKCAKIQVNPNMKAMSNSTSHPCLGSAAHRAMCSSEGTSPTAQITQVLDFVFLGSQDDAQDTEILKRHGITKVINLSDSCPKSDLIPNNCFMRIPIKDSYDTKIWPYFDKAYEFIEEARKMNERVLVHCLAGISRSPTLAIAYIMRAKALTCDEAYKFVKARRPSVSPNLNFMGQLFLYERHLREQNILPPARPRSNVIDDFTPPSKELIQPMVAEPPRPISLVTEKLCKSASADFSALKSDLTTSENRKRVMDTTFTLPCRPRQLIKNCCARKNIEETQQLPSPSTEFSKLDISLSNPCFVANPVSFESSQPQTSTQINAENPVFGLLERENRTHEIKKKPNYQLLNLIARRAANCKASVGSRARCKLSKCYTRGQKSAQAVPEENTTVDTENVRFRISKFSRLPTRTPINIMPTLHDDEIDSGKGSSVSHSISTEDGEVHSTANTTISSTSTRDPENDSLSSTSSLEIAVQ